MCYYVNERTNVYHVMSNKGLGTIFVSILLSLMQACQCVHCVLLLPGHPYETQECEGYNICDNSVVEVETQR